MQKCERCKEIKNLKAKGFCEKCYHKQGYPKWISKLREDPDKYQQYLDRQNAFRRKRQGLDYDKSLDLTPKYAPKGSGTRTPEGYRKIVAKGHVSAQKSGWILEHVFVMSNHLGRALLKNERVHHKNGIRDDNRIENLELWSVSQPPGQRVEDKIKWCKEFLELYDK